MAKLPDHWLVFCESLDAEASVHIGQTEVRVSIATQLSLLFCLVSFVGCKNVISGEKNFESSIFSKEGDAEPETANPTSENESDNSLFQIDLDPFEGVEISALQFRTAAASAYLFIKRRIIPTEVRLSIEDHSDYQALIESLVSSTEFEELMMIYHEEFFEIPGSDFRVFESSKNFATYLASFVVSDDRPYEEILTANYCVSRSPEGFEVIDGICPNDSPDLPVKSGVLSDTEMLVADSGSRNITRLKKATLRFVCHSFDQGPDPMDVGLAVGDVDTRYGGSAQGEAPQQVAGTGESCNSCHGSITARYGVYAPFRYSLNEAEFLFDPNRSIQDVEPEVFNGYETAHLDTGLYQEREILNLHDLALEMASDPRFSECATRRFYNFVFGEEALAEVPEVNLAYFNAKFLSSEQKVRSLFLSMINHPVYIQRFGESDSLE